VSERQRYGAGRTIFHQGEEARAMYLVELGTVEIVTAGD
jgi:CRP-like cAMP-binding protein